MANTRDYSTLGKTLDRGDLHVALMAIATVVTSVIEANPDTLTVTFVKDLTDEEWTTVDELVNGHMEP